MTTETLLTYALTLPGWCDYEKARWLCDLAASYSHSAAHPLCVELGVFGGRSLLPLAWGNVRGDTVAVDRWCAADQLEGCDRQQDIDWWQREDLAAVKSAFLKGLITTHLAGRVRIIELRTNQIVRLIDDKSVHLLHHDACHEQARVLADFQEWLPKLAPGGTIVVDDTEQWPGVRQALPWLAERAKLVYKGANWQAFQVS